MGIMRGRNWSCNVFCIKKVDIGATGYTDNKPRCPTVIDIDSWIFQAAPHHKFFTMDNP